MKSAIFFTLVSLSLSAQVPCPTCPPVVGVNAPAMTSTSGVSGTATQSTAGVYVPNAAHGATTFSVGQQTNTGGFAAQPTSVTGETANGFIQLDGWTTVSGTMTGDAHNSAATTYGSTGNTGLATVGQTGNGALTTSLLGSGNLQTGASALLGSIDGHGNLTSGGFASNSTLSNFNYCANGGQGWQGGGSTIGSGSATVGSLLNGFTVNGSATVTTTVCPIPQTGH